MEEEGCGQSTGGKRCRKSLMRAIREATSAGKTSQIEDVWAVTQYTKPQRSAAVHTISHQGVVADNHGDKTRMLVDISFPPLTPYEGDEGQEGPPGAAFQIIEKHLVGQAFRGTSSKSPGPDGIGLLEIRCIFD